MTTTFTTTEPGSARSKRRMAEQLLMQGIGGEPIQHWTQGLANMAKAALGGHQMHQLDNEEKAALGMLRDAPGLGSDMTPATQLAVAQPAERPQSRQHISAAVERAPGAAQPTAPTRVYSNDELSPLDAPAMAMARPPVASSKKWWGDEEGEAAGLYEPRSGATRLASAIPGQPLPAQPMNAAPAVPQEPVAASASGGPVIPPAVAAHIKKLMSNPYTLAQGQALYEQYTKPTSYGFQSTPDGTVLRTDPRRGTVEPAYRGQAKPTFGEIGTDPNTGQPVRGFIDTGARSVQPYQLPTQANAGPSSIPPVPYGVDPKVWREKHSTRAAEESQPADTKTVSALRNEVQGLPSYKNLAQAAPVYKSMVDAASRDNRAADVNLIYGMAKIMDPGSVVRESEMTVAQAVATMPQQLRATVESQMTSAGRLSPEVRAAIMQEARSRVSAYQGQFDQDAGMYRGIAQRGRMNEADVIPNFGEFKDYTPTPKQDAVKKVLKNRYGLE